MVVDAERGEFAEHALRLVVGAVDAVIGDLPAVGDRVQGGLGHGADHVGCDQASHVPGVLICGVLDAGGGPQRALRPGPGPLQRFPPLRGRGVLVALVGQPGVGDRGLAAHRGRPVGADLVQAPVHFGVHPGYEERGHRGDTGQVAPGGAGGFQPGQERLDHLGVAGQREDQCDVDADPFGQACADRRQALLDGGDFHEQVGPVHQPPQGARLGDRLGRVAGDPRVDLDRHPAVRAAGRVIDRAEHVAGTPHVGRGEFP